MLSVSPALSERRESPTLVVVTAALQLGFVIMVWLLALVPAALAALTVLTYKAVRGAFGVTPQSKPYDDSH